MARVVIPELLVLRLGALADARGLYTKVDQKFGAQLRQRTHDTHEPGIPVSLRWIANPVLGFPRTPFSVWRRQRTAKDEPAVAVLGANTPAAPAQVALPREVIELRFDAAAGPGGLRVEALSRSGKVLPRQRLDLSTPSSCRFRAPGIAGLRLSGAGSIGAIGAVEQTPWANLKDWVLVERVGFPFDPGQLPPADYEPKDQGWDGLTLDGPTAAEIRLGVAQLLQLDPPVPGAGLAAPSWPFPDPAPFLKVLRLGPLTDIEDCLRNSDDTDPAHLQALHVVARSLDGIHQPGLAPPADPATLALTTTAYIALAAHDGAVATGVGLGTIDTPQVAPPYATGDVMPAGTELGLDEYMVTATFTTPTGVLDLAAIGHRAAAPAPFTGVAAVQTFANRAMTRDAAASIAVRLGWNAHPEPVGAGLLLQAPPAATALLNTARPAGSGGFQPYLTEYRVADDGFPAADVHPGVTMPDEAIPLAGTAVTSYAAAPIDVHGRWGTWEAVTHTASAPAVQQPGLGDVTLELPAVIVGTGPAAAGCRLTCEVSWDWSDRSPDRIEISGAFRPVEPVPETATMPAGQFAVDSTAPALGVPLTVAFTAGGVPSIAPAAAGSPASVLALTQAATVTEIKEAGVMAGGPSPNDPDQIRRYRVTVPIMSVSFSTVSELAYAVSARAAERVRPAELSEPTAPLRMAKIADPFPAPPPTLPNVTVLWTAQPDAAGRARTVLSWPSVAGAIGYIVWEATETALSEAVGGVAVGGAMRARAADLKSRVAAKPNESLQAFSRLNERPQPGTSIELALPGSADTLFAYRVSTITVQNVESDRSPDIVLVGVPHRDVPGVPRLEARPSSATERVSLTVVPAAQPIVPGGPLTPAALRVHRVRRQSLAADVGTMGPPILSAATATLAPVPVPKLSGPAEQGWQFTDQVTASWSPYHYRCVTIGHDAPDDGVRAGESPPSGIVAVLVTPPLAPLLSTATRATGTAGVLIQLTTDLPMSPSPAGAGSLTIASVVGTQRTVVARLDSAEIPVAVAPSPMDSPVAAVTVTRAQAVAGLAVVSILVPAVQAPGTLVVTATDPLGRSTSVALEATP